MLRFLFGFLAAWFLVCTGSALNCEYDPSVAEKQGLNFLTAAGQVTIDPLEGVSDPDKCRERCCNSTECDLALVGYPMDGLPQCTLVKCWVNGQDGCDLKPSTQFKVYRKTSSSSGKTREEEEEVVEDNKLRVVPLVESFQPKESNESNNILCRQSMKVGPCRAAFPRYFYNSTAMSCEKFIFGGCGGNTNNFETKEKCEATCSGVTGSVLPDESTAAPPPIKAVRMVPALSREVSKDVKEQVEAKRADSEGGPTQKKEVSAKEFAERCGGEPVVGPCRAAFSRWYYNSKTGSCASFIYGGCRGNANNYATESSCVTACTVTVLPSAKKVATDVSMEYRENCLKKPDPGPCRAAFKSFFYSPDAGTCQEFFYGGCRGNKNRYESWAECMDSCDGLHVDARSENRWTAGLFLFITLVAISALLLVALVIMLRRRNVLRHGTSISDKEGLLPEEQSSVESLTTPDTPTKADKA